MANTNTNKKSINDMSHAERLKYYQDTFGGMAETIHMGLLLAERGTHDDGTELSRDDFKKMAKDLKNLYEKFIAVAGELTGAYVISAIAEIKGIDTSSSESQTTKTKH